MSPLHLSHRFHGIQPSKNSREKRAKKAAEEIAKKKLASDVGATSSTASLAHMKEVQKQAATPYVVLSGTVKPGQSRDAVSGGYTGGMGSKGSGSGSGTATVGIP